MMKSLFILVVIFVSTQTSAFTKERTSVSAIEHKIFVLVNQERKARNLPEVKIYADLTKLAQIQSYNMNKHVFFSHIDHLGRDPGRRKQVFFPNLFGGVGENIAYIHGIPPAKLAQKFMEIWMDSPGHKENILRESFNYLGVGVISDGNTYYATQIFGDLVAVMVGEPEDLYSYGSSVTFAFKFLGTFPKNELSIFVHFPDKEAKFFVGDDTFYKGVGVYQPEWRGNAFLIRITFDYGRGIYKLTMGRNGTYEESGLDIFVK